MNSLKLITALLIITGALSSCGDGTKKENQDDVIIEEIVETTTKDNRISFEEYMAQDTSMVYVPASTKVAYNSRSMGAKVKHKVSSDISKDFFKVSDDLIRVEIPVTSGNLKIIGVASVSSNNQNAIEIRLDGNNGVKTAASPITHLIKSDMKISKIPGLNQTMLKDTKQLKVFVVHENEKRTMAALSLCLIDCVQRAGTNYNDDNCNCDEIPDPWKGGDDNLKPKEVDGSVLQGD